MSAGNAMAWNGCRQCYGAGEYAGNSFVAFAAPFCLYTSINTNYVGVSRHYSFVWMACMVT